MYIRDKLIMDMRLCGKLGMQFVACNLYLALQIPQVVKSVENFQVH